MIVEIVVAVVLDIVLIVIVVVVLMSYTLDSNLAFRPLALIAFTDSLVVKSRVNSDAAGMFLFCLPLKLLIRTSSWA